MSATMNYSLVSEYLKKGREGGAEDGRKELTLVSQLVEI